MKRGYLLALAIVLTGTEAFAQGTDGYYKLGPDSLKQEGVLLLEALELSLQDRPPEEVERAYLRGREEAVKQQAALTDFRLYWEMLAAALSGREKVIVDADKVPGRRHLFLVPLEPFRMMFPAMPPPRGEPGTGP